MVTAFLASVGSFVVRASQTLLLPSLSRETFVGRWNALKRDKQLSVKMILINDNAKGPGGRQALHEHHDTVCHALAAAAPGSELSNVTCAEPLYLETSSCPQCAAALEKARRYYSSHLATAHAYLDSKEMHHWLRRFLPHVDYRAVTEHTLPVVVVHSHEFMLFDRTHQAVAFQDSVLAVVSSADSGVAVTFDYFCNSNMRRRLLIESDNAARAIVAAALDAMFGVAAVHERYDEVHNRVAHDFSWSVVPTPAGLFSSAELGAFYVRDQIGRNVAVLRASNIVHYLEGTLRDVEAADEFDMSTSLTADEYKQLTVRWNLWLWKRHEAENELSLYAYEHAVRYVDAMHKDLVAMLHILVRAAGRVHIERDCTKARPGVSFLDAMAATAVALSVALSGSLLYRIVHGAIVDKPHKKKRAVVSDRLPRSQDFLS